jgi:hypothetical protein
MSYILVFKAIIRNASVLKFALPSRLMSLTTKHNQIFKEKISICNLFEDVVRTNSVLKNYCSTACP